jgi:hypothetical protein
MACLMLLAACNAGGRSDTAGPQPPAAVRDSFILRWNAPQDLDVLANDRDPQNSALTLVSASGAQHGTLSVANGQVRYTPAVNYYGDDAFTYTVRNAQGLTSTGQVSLIVRARLLLQGRIPAASGQGASVAAITPAGNVSTRTDASGAFSLSLESVDPADTVRLEARNVGGTSTFALASFLGSYDRLVDLQDAQGTIDATRLPALTVTAFTTAQYSLAMQSGGLPKTDELWTLRQKQQDAAALTTLAATIDEVAAGRATLPAGIPDTLAMAQSLAAYANVANTRFGDASVLPSVLDATLAGAAPRGIMAGRSTPRTLFVFTGGRSGLQEGWLLVLYPDGRAEGASARLGGSFDGARWSEIGGTLTITLAAPQGVTLFDQDANGQLVQTRTETYTALQLRWVAGEVGFGVAGFRAMGSLTIAAVGGTPGINALGTRFEPVSVYADEGFEPLSASELTGQRWVGLPIVPDHQDFTAEDLDQTALQFLDGTRGQRRDGRTFTWSMDGSTLQLDFGGALLQRAERLWRDPDTGEEAWMAFSLVGGDQIIRGVYGARVFRADPDFAWQPAWAAGTWLDDPVGVRPGTVSALTRLLADGSGATLIRPFGGNATTQQTTLWHIDPATGRLVQRATSGFPPALQRDWLPLARLSGTTLLVLEDTEVPAGANALLRAKRYDRQ